MSLFGNRNPKFKISDDFTRRTKKNLASAQKVYYTGSLTFLRFKEGHTWIDPEYGRLFLPDAVKAIAENIYRVPESSLKPVLIMD